MPDEHAHEPFAVRFRPALNLIPLGTGAVTVLLLWGEKAEPPFFATAAEVIAVGAVALALQGGMFRLTGDRSHRPRGTFGLAVILVAVGVGLGFCFGALAREDGGGPAHLAFTAGALAMGIAEFAIQAFIGPPREEG